MRKKNKTNAKSRDSEAKRARTRDTGHGTRETGDRTQDIMFAPCLKFLPLVCVLFLFLFYTHFFLLLPFPALLFISCVTHFSVVVVVVVSLRQMKCIKFRDMRGASRAEAAGAGREEQHITSMWAKWQVKIRTSNATTVTDSRCHS